jgi:hypothetical protein
MSDDPAPIPVPLEYRGPVERLDLPPPWKLLSFRIAIVCWLLPLVAGVSTFLIWLIHRSEVLFGAGYIVILAGTGLAIIGGISSLVLLASRWATSRRRFHDAVMPAICLMLLIGSNFVVASVLIMEVINRLPPMHHGP